MKRFLQNDDSTVNEQNEGASTSKSRSTHVNNCLTKNTDESEIEIGPINETTDSNDDMANDTSDITLNEKRTDYLSWDDLFMAIAFLIAKCNKDFGTKVGACIVDSDKKVVGIGYNTTQRCSSEYVIGCHAEMNAILNRNSLNVQNCTIYVSLYPCSECAKIIIQSGIKEVVYLPYPNSSRECSSSSQATKKMFDASDIKIREHTPKQNIPLRFSKTDELDLNWDNLYMAIALLMAKRSKDPVTQVGACIVDSNGKILSTGYNGMPTGCNDDKFPWGKGNYSELQNKFIYVCHAEMNAVFYKSSISVKGCTIYVSHFPCIECAQIIIQSGIKNVVYFIDPKKKKYKSARKLFHVSSVEIKEHVPNLNITLDFSKAT